MRRHLNRKIARMEKEVNTKKPKVDILFAMREQDIEQAKRQRYGANIPDDAGLLVVTFRSV